MIAILCGKSASGKDTLLNKLREDGFGSVISTTSRPMRDGETQGVEYNFVSKEEFVKGIETGSFLEYRSYTTSVGNKPDVWYYGCPKKTIDSLDPQKDYAIILDMQGAKDLVNYCDPGTCFVCYVETDNEIRKERAMSRGSFDEAEWNRRAADDEVKFSDDVVNSLANARISNNVGSVDDLEASFLGELAAHKENLQKSFQEADEFDR